MDLKKKRRLAVLPRVFHLPTGTVNSEILKRVFNSSSMPSPSRRLRDLLRKICGQKLRPMDSPFEKLTEHIGFVDFRERWYALGHADRKKYPAPLYVVVDRYVSLKHPTLGFSSDSLTQFFEKRSDRNGSKIIFPRLERIEVLTEQLIDVAENALEDSALFAWSLLERAEWRLISLSEDESLTRFREVLLGALIGRGANNLLDQLTEETASNSESNSSQRNQRAAKGSRITGQTKKLAQIEVVAEKDEPEFVKSLNELHVTTLAELNALSQQATAEHKDSIGVFERILSSSESSMEIENIFRSLENLRVQVSRAKEVVENFEDTITDRLKSATQSFCIYIVQESLPKFSFGTHGDWERAASVRLNLSKDILRWVNAIAKHEEELVRAVIPDRQIKRFPLTEIAQYLEMIDEAVASLSEGVAAKRRILSILEQKKDDFAWNPILAPDIPSDEWIRLGKYLGEQRQLPQLFGTCVRINFIHLRSAVETYVDRVTSDEDMALDSAIAVLRSLTLGQLEDLRFSNSESKVLTAIVELESFLQMAEVSRIEAYAFWSAKPLGEYIQRNAPDVTSQFFAATYEASSSDGFGPMTLAELRRLANISELRCLLASSSLVERSTVKSADELLSKNLSEIIEYHPGGGPTHAHLWEEAYKIICKPLLPMCSKEKVGQAAEYYRRFRSHFDIDNHIDEWKATLPERLRKQSQYEKKLRLSVETKLDALDEWLDSYDATNRVSGKAEIRSAATKLNAAIDDVLLKSEVASSVLRRWLQSLSRAPDLQSVNLTSSNRTLEANVSEPMVWRTEDPLHPRCFMKTLEGETVSVGDYLADAIFLNFGLYGTESLAKTYAESNCLEAFASLCASAQQGIPLELERRVDVAVENMGAECSARIEAIESRVGAFPEDIRQLIASSLEEARNYVSSQRWTRANSELSDIEQTLNGIIRDEEVAGEVARLQSEIGALGRPIPVNATVEFLREALGKAVAETLPRRKHLQCLKRLQETEGLDHIVKLELLQTIAKLERAENLPDVIRSEEVAYVFSETVEVLGEQLRRSKNFVPAYTRKLQHLALVFSKCLRLTGVCDGSLAVSVLIESESDWQAIPEGSAEVLEQLLSYFSIARFGDELAIELRTPADDPHTAVEPEHVSPAPTEGWQRAADIFAAYLNRFEAALVRISSAGENKTRTAPEGQSRELPDSDHVASAIRARRSFEKCDDRRGSLALERLTDWAVLVLRERDTLFSVEEHAAALHLINTCPGSTSVVGLLPSKNSKGRLGEMTAKFMVRIGKECGLVMPPNAMEQILTISENIDQLKAHRSLVVVAFSPNGSVDSVTARSLWDSYSGDARQADARAALMNIFWQTSATTALARCLSYSPIDLDHRRAAAFAHSASQALEQGRVGQLQSFMDLRKSVQAKPFQLFVDTMQGRVAIQAAPPASISLSTPLEGGGKGNLYRTVLSIKPRAAERPDSITLVLPQTAPLQFDEALPFRCILEGPFLEEETQIPMHFRLLEASATEFSIPVECEAISINGTHSKFSVTLDVKIGGSQSFLRPKLVEIEEAFGGFPDYQVRGLEYVPRANDEKKIEKALFESERVRSLWISSPRRSGKTTMLYWILDAYSHKANRDSLVAYFTLNTSFSTSAEFNQWIWKALLQKSVNRELRDCFTNFSEIGREISFEADCATFLDNLSNLLKSKSHLKVNRIIYLIDEVDRFASMYFEGGAKKDTSMDIAWQIRELLGERRDIGFVFAGSSAAKKIFISNPEAPFFNTGLAFELTPFSCEGVRQEDASRAIVEVPRMRGRFQLPKKTLEHLIWVCAGIPYYMKLLAGATMAVSRQSYLLVADVNAGLKALLSKSTGISKLDEISGAPGSDELRTVALELREERLLTEAVVYAVAEMHSPLSGHPLFRGKVFSTESPLVSRYGMSKDKIEKGLELAIDLGILRRSTDTYQEISFAIPILGEAIRYSCGSFWGSVEHQLEELTKGAQAS